MGFKGPWRRAALVSACVATGAGILALHALLQMTPAPDPGEYFLTDLARAQLGPLSISLALLLAVALGFVWLVPPPVVGLSMVATFPMIALYEATVFRGSHNLIPIEFAIVALWSVPLILAAAVGRWTARRLGRHDVWAGDSASP